jgi:hypothetical protein
MFRETDEMKLLESEVRFVRGTAGYTLLDHKLNDV